MQKLSNFRRLALRLLATTCLIAASTAVAMASTAYTGPYGTTFETATDVEQDSPVSGSFGGTDNSEFFEFEGLTAGTSLSSIFTVQDTSSLTMGLTILNTSDVTIFGQDVVGANSFASLTGVVPDDGNVIFQIESFNEGPLSFNVTLTPNASAPEPATVGIVGLGLAGLAAAGLRRRLQKS